MDHISWKRKSEEKNEKQRILDRKQGEILYLGFPALEETGMVQHLFSTRVGGVSEGIFSSMNLSYTRGDRKETVDENFRRMAKLLGRKTEDFVLADQTHTTNVRQVGKADRGKGILYSRDYHDVDGLITNEEDVVLVTFYADCVPLYFVDIRNRAIGLSHSGWRGTAGGMAARTLEAMGTAFGTRPEDVRAAIGPSICRDCYEVDEDVAGEFVKAFGAVAEEAFLEKKNEGKYQLDLWKANAYVLQMAGVPKEQISITDLCTCCNPDLLFSHRASQGRRGNLAAFLALKKGV